MKTTRTFILIATVFSVGWIAAWWCSAQSSTPAKKTVTGDDNPALDRLTALVSYLEANKQTNALKLFNEYSHASIALQHSADMGMTLHILKELREGRTTNAIEMLEGRLDTDIIGFAASFKEMPKEEQEWLGLRSLSDARWYRDKYPHKHRYQNVDDGVAQAFSLVSLNSAPIRGSTPEQSMRNILPKVGQKITYSGTIQPGKFGPYLTPDHWVGIYIETKTTNSADLVKLNEIDRLAGHVLTVEGVLRHTDERASTGPLDPGMAEHFYFDVREISYSEAKGVKK